MIPSSREQDSTVWNDFVHAYKEYSLAFRNLLGPEIDRVALVRSALDRGGPEKLAVAQVLPHLSQQELESLFDVLIDWCGTGHSLVHIFRDAVKRLPRASVLARIEAVAEPLLRDGTEDEYRRFLELYRDLDHDLALGLARRAMAHDVDAIQEVGEEFLERLGDRDPVSRLQSNAGANANAKASNLSTRGEV